MANMRAGVFTGRGHIELQELPIPQPGPGQVLLKVVGCGVCGTDYHIFEGELTDGVAPPVVLGHEIAARVQKLGPDLAGLEAGQFCAIDPVIGCGVCRQCQLGRPNLCRRPLIIGYGLNGGFAQYLLAPASKVVAMSDRFGPAGGILCETLACVLNGYSRLGLYAGASAMVLGAGTVGLLWTQLLAQSPCRPLVVSEPVAMRRELAAKLGATHVIDPAGGDLPAQVRAVAGEGLDFIVDATGEPAAIEQALPLLGPGGTFMIFGVCPAGASVQVDPFELYNKQARVIASKMPPGTLDRSARLIESGRIACREIVTGTLPLGRLAEAVEGFNANRNRQVKVAIDPWA
jgi:L-iditol 2-dehydrogenase